LIFLIKTCTQAGRHAHSHTRTHQNTYIRWLLT
jgi:hypothetical protein